jgi:heme exporter protein CcmD
MNGFLAMEGYTGYLVVAYGVTALVVIGNVFAARRQFRRTRLRLREQLERRSGRRPSHVTQTPGQAGNTGGNEATVGRGS